MISLSHADCRDDLVASDDEGLAADVVLIKIIGPNLEPRSILFHEDPKLDSTLVVSRTRLLLGCTGRMPLGEDRSREEGVSHPLDS